MYALRIPPTKPLSAHEEATLVSQARQGDRQAMQHLIASSMHGIDGLVQLYRLECTDISDATQTALLSFMSAVYAMPSGKRVWSAAKYAIITAVRMESMENVAAVTVPRRTASRYLEAMRTCATLSDAQAHATATGHMGREAFYAAHAALQPSAPSGVPDDSEKAGRVDTYDAEKAEYLDQLLCLLPERSANIVRMSVGMDGPPMSDADIGKALHLSRCRVSTLRSQALTTMREIAEQ